MSSFQRTSDLYKENTDIYIYHCDGANKQYMDRENKAK